MKHQEDPYYDPHWPCAKDWLDGDYLAKATKGLAVIGVPTTLGSIPPAQCQLAPQAIRAALHHFSTYDLSAGRDLRHLRARDVGDLAVAELSPNDAFIPIRDAVAAQLGDMTAAVLLGGDNSLTAAGVHALGVGLDRCGLLSFDAHFDMGDLDRGLNNHNSTRRLLEDGLAGDHIYKIGLQRFASSDAYARLARTAGIHVITSDQVMDLGITKAVHQALGHLQLHVDRIYVSVDMDVLDRIHAPAAHDSLPGGLFPGQMRRAAHLCGLHPKVRALDLTELDPTHDVADITAMTAASCLLEFAAGILARPTHV
ncbi:MAG TPA: arginase family protein [Candidatus Sulfopaludibacter sp.]|jgi:formiminoglutamase|nr:arginase family protein [Candidatus Sulfopaludibacter sp.]